MRHHQLAVSVAASALFFVTGWARAEVALPTIEGPITEPRIPALAATTFPLGDHGYVQEEFFISGEATSYTSDEALTSDGLWSVTPADTTTYKTRIVVHRPIDPEEFNGTVFVEWLNVSGGLDAPPDWLMGHTQIMRMGMAWVGVSAQFVGVEGGGGGIIELPLKTLDAERYESLLHPGDSFSFDMYAQAGRAVRDEFATVLGGLEPKRVIAGGQSQSAARLTTYINAVHPIAGLFDGFFVHSRPGSATHLSQDPQENIPPPSPALIRTDISTPVFTIQVETDMRVLGFFPARQPDTETFRLWELPGASHTDLYTLRDGMGDVGGDPSVARVKEVSDPIPGLVECDGPVNDGPHHFLINAAIFAMDRWLRRGVPPTIAPRIQMTTDPELEFERDEHGNALGGIRTPWLDAPLATLSGEGQMGSGFCFLFGATELFDEAKLATLYPTRRAFAQPFRASLRAARKNRFLRRHDTKLIRRSVRDVARR